MKNGTEVLAPEDRLMVSLGSSNYEQATVALRDFAEQVRFYMASNSWQVELIRSERDSKHAKIFFDAQLHGMPNEIGATVASYAGKCDMISVHISAGSKALEAAVKNKNGCKILGMTVLTSLDAGDLHRMGYDSSLGLGDIVLRKARMALECGCDGVICPPHQLEILSGHREFDQIIKVAPGIRIERLPDDESHRRTMTPAQALEMGATYLAVGHPILRHPVLRRSQALRSYFDNVRKALSVAQAVACA